MTAVPQEIKPLSANNKALLSHHVAEVLRTQIFNGAFTPGQRIRESVLAEQLGVSRGPVRDAITTLHHEGLIALSQRRSPTVVELTKRDADEIFSLREPLEILAATRAAQSHKQADLVRMEQELTNQTTAYAEEDYVALSISDVRFHTCIYAASDHSQLQMAWNNIRSQVTLYLVHRNKRLDSMSQTIVSEHRTIMNAIAEGQPPDRIETLIKEHLAESYNQLIDHIDY